MRLVSLPPSLATMTTTTVFSFFFFFLFSVRFPENLRLFKARYFKRNWRYEGMRERGGDDRVEDYTAESILPDTRRRETASGIQHQITRLNGNTIRMFV